MKLLATTAILQSFLFCAITQGHNLLVNGSFETPPVGGGNFFQAPDVKTAVGTDYTLKLQHSPRPGSRSTFKVVVDSKLLATFAEDGTSLTGHKWLTFTTRFTATTNLTTVILSDTGSAANGTHLDNVVLEEFNSIPLRA